ncbi:aldo/keto reductase [Thalassotalea marina]|uniref:Aldo/keto reductase n=1 Tax=Thalassotalea marina TaxID=1673741 RepID=A0A919EP10_9GAMM|nr:aldo/keto reductase [Thalassotalea marina]GHG01641.1 aldo/keto reductase [Thalassotalea marina]
MKYVRLGSSDLEVSRVCLGTMTWGVQNNQQDADQQLELAQYYGVNFIDTAEMYAIPPNKNTYGKTESIIGNYLRANPTRRDNLVIASKIAGPGLSYIRGGSEISSTTVKQAVDDSLTRLQTDYIDLYQLHWPNYTSPHFAKHWPNDIAYTQFNAEQEKEKIHDILTGLADCVKAGKIRYCGLSDDTPWGIMQYLKLAEQHNLPKIVSIQNEFSLLHTKDWPYLVETCVHEDIAYLPWSPLATGLLTGKYLNGARPEGSRWTLMQRHGLFRDTEQTHMAVQAFVDIAKKHQLAPAQLALAWVNQVEGVTSTIIGATSVEQLTENIEAFDLKLSAEVLSDITSWLKTYHQPF